MGVDIGVNPITDTTKNSYSKLTKIFNGIKNKHAILNLSKEPHHIGEVFYFKTINNLTMGKLNLEIRDAEGGTDAKLLVSVMKEIYTKTAKNNNLECTVVEERNGFAHLCL